MNKCRYCGTEFEGKFCPECGKKWESEKTCPKCGAVCQPTVKFCNECGYSFTEAKPAVAEQPRQSTTAQSSSIKSNLIKVLRFTPYILFGLYALLLFAFCAAPMAVMPANLFLPTAESMGSAYKDFIANAEEMKAHVIALWVIVGLTAFVALITCLPKLSSDKRKAVLLNKPKVLSKTLVIFVLLYLANIIISGIIMSEIAKLGEGLIVAGACPKLILSFAVIFGVFTIAALVAAVYMSKSAANAPQSISSSVVNNAAEEEHRNRYYTTHTEPICEGSSKKAKARYKLAKKRYDNCKEGAPSDAAVWFTAYRTPLAVVAAILAAIVVVLCITIPMATNIFRVGKVKKIELGYTQTQVEKILGKPFEETKTDTVWEYYDSDYMKVAEKLLKNSAEQEKALEIGDLSKLNKLTTEYESLELKLQSTEYDYIEVQFEKEYEKNEYVVSNILLFKNYKESLEKQPKKIIKEVSIENSSNIGIIVDADKNTVYELTQLKSDKATYSAEFKDGSYVRGYTSNSVAKLDGKNATVTWNDSLGEYSTVVQTVRVGEIRNDGYIEFNLTYEQKKSLTSITLPEGVKGIGRSAFYGCSSLMSITIPESVTSIEERVFYNCSSLTSVTIPDSVTSIGRSAFYGCSSLMSVTIPDSVTSIEIYVFTGCRSLSKVYYKGSLEAWKKISIDSSNTHFIDATRYYYSATQPEESGNYWHYDNDGNIIEW